MAPLSSAARTLMWVLHRRPEVPARLSSSCHLCNILDNPPFISCLLFPIGHLQRPSQCFQGPPPKLTVCSQIFVSESPSGATSTKTFQHSATQPMIATCPLPALVSSHQSKSWWGAGPERLLLVPSFLSVAVHGGGVCLANQCTVC